MVGKRCWEPKILTKISSHYKTREPLSPEFIDKLIKRSVPVAVSSTAIHKQPSRYVNGGLFQLQQIFLSKFDLIVHTKNLPGMD